jgi:hypothetical protein
MMPALSLGMSGVLHARAQDHLFPGDGLEAAAILLCARTPSLRVRLLAREVVLVPHAACSRREQDGITWPGGCIEQAIDLAEPEGLAIVLVHSHPGGLFAFSDVDDASDRRVIPGLFQAFGALHGSAIMTPDGAIRARLYTPSMDMRPVDLVTVAGHDLWYWWEDNAWLTGPTARPVAFTGGMTRELGRLSAAVIGVSGTGSIVAEQLARLGFGKVALIDFDRIEKHNLNRILNMKLSDAAAGRLNVEALGGYRGGDVAKPVAVSVMTREAVLAASQCDVLFCCVDTLEARQVADLIAAAFLLPLFDVGVVIPTREAGGTVAIADACGRIDYVQPGRSTLQDRGVHTPTTVRAEYLRKVAPDAHRQELEAGYFKGLVEEAPAVITLNMRAAAACVNEFIARISVSARAQPPLRPDAIQPRRLRRGVRAGGRL